jgi:hypothetical protein
MHELTARVNLAFLRPELVETIVQGQQPVEFTRDASDRTRCAPIGSSRAKWARRIEERDRKR